MIDYQKLEDDICSLLNIKSAKVTVLPDNNKEATPNFKVPTVYIACVGSKFEDSENNQLVIQSERINFEAIIRSQTRRGKNGIFAILKELGTKLQGLKFNGYDPILLDSHGHIDGTQNDWNYMLSFHLDGKCVASQRDPESIDTDHNIYALKHVELDSTIN